MSALSLGRQDLAAGLLLSAASALFLWMYVASAGLESAVRANPGATSHPARAAPLAMEFAHEWRHGLAGWPIFVPGFFLSGVAVAVAARRRSLVAFAALGCAALLVGALVAVVLGGPGSGYVARLFEARTGTGADTPRPAPFPSGVLVAAATLVAWAVLLLAIQRAVLRRTVRPLVLPAALYAGVATVRGGGDFGALASVWIARLAAGDGLAVGSSAALILLAAFFVKQAWDDGRVALAQPGPVRGTVAGAAEAGLSRRIGPAGNSRQE